MGVEGAAHRQAQEPQQEQVQAWVAERAAAARRAGRQLSLLSAQERAAAIAAAADAVEAARAPILQANAEDLQRARESQLAAPLLDRLELTEARFASMVQGMREVAAQADPLGPQGEAQRQASGFWVQRTRVPLGVVGIIYESRPNVTADAAAICLRSGNAAVLRGGSEALRSNAAIATALRAGLALAGAPEDALVLLDRADRAAVQALLHCADSVDVMVARGGRGLVELMTREARMPVIKHLDGICHAYLHGAADEDMAVAVAVNGKCYRYGICGATETVLVDRSLAGRLVPRLAAQLAEWGVQIRGCGETCALAPEAAPASEADYATEWLGPTLSMRVVQGLDEAVEHIERHGSHHTDTIVTSDESAARDFCARVDSSSVMHNLPTCFADGREYGLGAEIGISTDRFHARGPVGAEGLTIYKYLVRGEGQERS